MNWYDIPETNDKVTVIINSALTAIDDAVMALKHAVSAPLQEEMCNKGHDDEWYEREFIHMYNDALKALRESVHIVLD